MSDSTTENMMDLQRGDIPGTFAGPFLDANSQDADDFRQLWNSQPARPLGSATATSTRSAVRIWWSPDGSPTRSSTRDAIPEKSRDR